MTLGELEQMELENCICKTLWLCMANKHLQKLAQTFMWYKSAYLPFDKHKLVLSLSIRDMAAHQTCDMEKSQEKRNELVDVIMLICHITKVADPDFIMMHIYLQ